MQQPENRLGQEKEPAPVDAIKETSNVFSFFVVADRFPFFRAGKQTGRDGCSCTRFYRLDWHDCFDLEQIAGRKVLADRPEWLRLIWDQRRHPKMVCIANPAVCSHVDAFGLGTFTGVNVIVFDLAVFCFFQFTVRHTDHTFVKDEEVFQVGWLAVPAKQAVRTGRDCCTSVVFDALFERKHKFVVDADSVAECKVSAVIPDQSYGAIRREYLAALKGP